MEELRWEKFSDYLFVKKIIKVSWKFKYWRQFFKLL